MGCLAHWWRAIAAAWDIEACRSGVVVRSLLAVHSLGQPEPGLGRLTARQAA